ncbi:glycosyl hydrolase [Tessaracoccus lacteus]|uniref:glucan endo-1,3-beta-D-glucosidase n=1 Tax=Tessaracoccus lacteus TaxID=3041766 RepID=A0ABY8PY58_9ACTN|nr:glycosyl hydrolase [Tessaracoccus sp. T21]WGT47421.1 glycosyl hydrolase [Tessaracoccus sp. T21]
MGAFDTPIGRRAALGILGSGAAAGLAACGSGPPTPKSASVPSSVSGDAVTALLAAVPKRTIKDLNAKRLADGLTPPTNRWFSGLVFGDDPQAVFPMPIGFAVAETGFEIWLPQVSANGTSIIGARAGGLTCVIDSASVSAMVIGYDVASVAVELRDGEDALAELRLVQGSPTVSLTARRDLTVAAPVVYERAGDAWQVTVEGTLYGLVGADSVNGTSATIASGSTVTWFAAPPGGSVADLAEKVAPVTATGVTWELADDDVTTTLRFDGGPTLLTALPHHSLVDAGEQFGAYDTVLGEAGLFSVETLRWTSKRWPIEPSLDLSGLGSDDRKALAEQVAADVAAAPTYPTDTYFGGKALYREAMLLQIATAVGADDAAATITGRLTDALTTWTEPAGADRRATQCFVYDEDNRGMVGLEPSFGSDEFNDHHFHYGYFLYAAGVLCADNPDLTAKLSPVLDLVAADIASPTDTGDFPQFRPFDVYASHSWASGTAPFADGNNQESSSEGVNAWAGLALWARARGDEGLEQQAVWMHALESAGALAYWLQPETRAGFDHTVVGIGWGGKRDYLTWFSPDPAAILAIQVLPASPSHGYLAAAPDKVPAAVTEALQGEAYGRQYTDWVLLYSALAGGDGAASAVDQIAAVTDKLDDGLTLSYLRAFLLTR